MLGLGLGEELGRRRDADRSHQGSWKDTKQFLSVDSVSRTIAFSGSYREGQLRHWCWTIEHIDKKMSPGPQGPGFKSLLCHLLPV